jgi:ribosome-binding protein aMBF1 (putative translation factor)
MPPDKVAQKATSLDELRRRRPGNEQEVARLRDEMLAESRGYRLAELRQASNLTQRDLAAILGVDQSRVSRIERGDLTRTELGTLAAYVRALGGEVEISVRFGEERHLMSL